MFERSICWGGVRDAMELIAETWDKAKPCQNAFAHATSL